MWQVRLDNRNNASKLIVWPTLEPGTRTTYRLCISSRLNSLRRVPKCLICLDRYHEINLIFEHPSWKILSHSDKETGSSFEHPTPGWSSITLLCLGGFLHLGADTIQIHTLNILFILLYTVYYMSLLLLY